MTFKGEGVYAYICLKELGEELTQAKSSEIINELRQSVKKNISGFAVPEKLQICSGLPKTRSGSESKRVANIQKVHILLSYSSRRSKWEQYLLAKNGFIILNIKKDLLLQKQ